MPAPAQKFRTDCLYLQLTIKRCFMKSVTSLLSLINSGASIVINGKGVAASSLISLATAAAAKNVHLTITDISGTADSTLLSIAAAGKGSVTLDFSRKES